MAVRTPNGGMVGIPLNPLPQTNGSHPAAHNGRGDLELLGRLLRDSPARDRVAASSIGLDADETLRALRLLALDNLIAIVELRENLAEREAQVASLTEDVERWRAQAVAERARRTTDAAKAQHHERELVTALHRQMIDIDTLSCELSWRRQPWYRRPSARRKATVKRPPSSAPR